jgi:hypothetical protein
MAMAPPSEPSDKNCSAERLFAMIPLMPSLWRLLLLLRLLLLMALSNEPSVGASRPERSKNERMELACERARYLSVEL